MKAKTEQYLRTKWPAILWSVIVFILLAMPSIQLTSEKKIELTNIDKVIHFILFFTLVVLWGYYLQAKKSLKTKFLYSLLAVTLIATSYGIVMEYVQLLTGRDFDVWDMVADGLGAVAGFSLFAIKNKPR